MARLKDLMNVHIKEVEAILAQTELLLQKPSGGQSGELKTSGSLVENYLRGFISSISPSGIHVTSGYVVNQKTLSADKNLPQHDIILSDKASPSLFSIVDGEIEIVAVESLVGIIEVKRTLTKSSINSAQDQIKSTYESAIKDYKTKSESINTVSISTLKPGTQSPLFGIIGLSSEISDEELVKVIDPGLIDFVWSMKIGTAYLIGGCGGESTGTVSRFGLKSPRMLKVDGSEAVVFSKVKGILRFWLSGLASQWMKADAIKGYYLDIWDQDE